MVKVIALLWNTFLSANWRRVPSNQLQLSPHSALMGGQFPTKKGRGAFKNPIFYAGKFHGIFQKNELSDFDGPKPGFYAFLHGFLSYDALFSAKAGKQFRCKPPFLNCKT